MFDVKAAGSLAKQATLTEVKHIRCGKWKKEKETSSLDDPSRTACLLLEAVTFAHQDCCELRRLSPFKLASYECLVDCIKRFCPEVPARVLRFMNDLVQLIIPIAQHASLDMHHVPNHSFESHRLADEDGML